MKHFNLFFEAGEAKAQEKAKMLGLAYSGFGLWKDPKTGKVTHRTENDDLVPIKHDAGIVKAEKSPEEDLAAAKLKQVQDEPGKPKIAAGDMIGAAGEGDAQAPSDTEVDPAQMPSDMNQEQGWDAGPDGDHCVDGSEPKPEGIPQDSFVSRGINDKKWVAGPDGSNLKNTSFDEMRRTMEQVISENGNPTGTGLQSPGERAASMGLQSDGKGGYTDPKTGQVVARTVNNELVFYDTGPSGGVVADGNGGAYITQAQPSWRDPRTGMSMTPPCQPESPQEAGSVPEPIPATSPMGFNSFMKKKQADAYEKPLDPRTMGGVEQPPSEEPEEEAPILTKQ